ncbi:hypothetical protein N7501_000958 [Penicillium viridicatum]|nr:hypothetical protein N7501_000958 [Penicillium viridicatum]
MSREPWSTLKAWHEVDRLYNIRRKSDSKQLVSIKGLSGWKIYYGVRTGQLLSGVENEEWEVQQPKLRYSCYEQLVSAVDPRSIKLVEPFFPLQIEHFMLALASDTKQPTSPKYAENPVAVDDALKASPKSRKKTAGFQEINSILEFVFNVHEVTKVVGIAFHDPLQITKFTNIHHSDLWSWRAPASGQSADWSVNHPIPSPSTSINRALLSTISTSLTVAGFTASGQSADWSVNHPIQFNQPSNSINRPLRSSNSITTSLTVAGFGFRTIGTIVGRHNPNNDGVWNMIESEYNCYEFWGIYGAGRGPFMANLVVHIRRQVE